MTGNASPRRTPLALDLLYYAAAIAFLGYMLFYYWTGMGGPTLLAIT